MKTTHTSSRMKYVIIYNSDLIVLINGVKEKIKITFRFTKTLTTTAGT